MGYADTIYIEKLRNKFVVHAGLFKCTVGEKQNYFRIYDPRTVTKVVSDAHNLLGSARFPDGENSHETEAEALLYAEKYRAYVLAVVALPAKCKVGHSCEFWK